MTHKHFICMFFVFIAAILGGCAELNKTLQDIGASLKEQSMQATSRASAPIMMSDSINCSDADRCEKIFQLTKLYVPRHVGDLGQLASKLEDTEVKYVYRILLSLNGINVSGEGRVVAVKEPMTRDRYKVVLSGKCGNIRGMTHDKAQVRAFESNCKSYLSSSLISGWKEQMTDKLGKR